MFSQYNLVINLNSFKTSMDFSNFIYDYIVSLSEEELKLTYTNEVYVQLRLYNKVINHVNTFRFPILNGYYPFGEIYNKSINKEHYILYSNIQFLSN